MKITNTTSVTLTPDEVKEIIIQHLSDKGIIVSSVYFYIKAQYDDTNLSGEFGPDYGLGSIECK